MPTELPHPSTDSGQPAQPNQGDCPTPPGSSNADTPISPPLAPPTQPGQLGTRGEGKSWPSVLGTIAIIFGVLGILGGIFGLFGPAIMRAVSSVMPKNAPTGLEAYDDWSGWMRASSVVAMLIAALLLVGGIRLYRRRGSSVRIIRRWAVIKIVYAIGATAVNYQIQQEQFEAMAQGGGGAATPVQMAGVMAAVTVGISVLWLCALPVFMLIWLSRRKVREEFGGWG